MNNNKKLVWASINGKEILKGLNLQVNVGEIHAIMDSNGSGKSKLYLNLFLNLKTQIY